MASLTAHHYPYAYPNTSFSAYPQAGGRQGLTPHVHPISYPAPNMIQPNNPWLHPHLTHARQLAPIIPYDTYWRMVPPYFQNCGLHSAAAFDTALGNSNPCIPHDQPRQSLSAGVHVSTSDGAEPPFTISVQPLPSTPVYTANTQTLPVAAHIAVSAPVSTVSAPVSTTATTCQSPEPSTSAIHADAALPQGSKTPHACSIPDSLIPSPNHENVKRLVALKEALNERDELMADNNRLRARLDELKKREHELNCQAAAQVSSTSTTAVDKQKDAIREEVLKRRAQFAELTKQHLEKKRADAHKKVQEANVVLMNPYTDLRATPKTPPPLINPRAPLQSTKPHFNDPRFAKVPDRKSKRALKESLKPSPQKKKTHAAVPSFKPDDPVFKPISNRPVILHHLKPAQASSSKSTNVSNVPKPKPVSKDAKVLQTLRQRPLTLEPLFDWSTKRQPAEIAMAEAFYPHLLPKRTSASTKTRASPPSSTKANASSSDDDAIVLSDGSTNASPIKSEVLQMDVSKTDDFPFDRRSRSPKIDPMFNESLKHDEPVFDESKASTSQLLNVQISNYEDMPVLKHYTRDVFCSSSVDPKDATIPYGDTPPKLSPNYTFSEYDDADSPNDVYEGPSETMQTGAGDPLTKTYEFRKRKPIPSTSSGNRRPSPPPDPKRQRVLTKRNVVTEKLPKFGVPRILPHMRQTGAVDTRPEIQSKLDDLNRPRRTAPFGGPHNLPRHVVSNKLTDLEILQNHLEFEDIGPHIIDHEQLSGSIINTNMRITNMYGVPDPQERLERIIEIMRQRCLDLLIDHTGFDPEHPPMISYEFTSDAYDKGPIFAYRSIDDVDFKKIMAREVMKVDQSKNVLTMVDTSLSMRVQVYKALDDVRMPQSHVGTGDPSGSRSYGTGNPFIDDEAAKSGDEAEHDDDDASEATYSTGLENFIDDEEISDYDVENRPNPYNNPVYVDRLKINHKLNFGYKSPSPCTSRAPLKEISLQDVSISSKQTRCYDFDDEYEDMLMDDGSFLDDGSDDASSPKPRPKLLASPKPQVRKYKKKKHPLPVRNKEYGLYFLENDDEYCLFRSFIMAYHYATLTSVLASGEVRQFNSFLKKEGFGKHFYQYTNTQYRPLTRDDKKKVIMEAKKDLFKPILKAFHRTDKLSVLAKNLDKEIDKIRTGLENMKSMIDDRPGHAQLYDMVMNFKIPKYSKSVDRVWKEVEVLMNELKIPFKQKAYAIEDYGPKLQEWLDAKEGPGRLRLMCYGKNQNAVTKDVLFKGDCAEGVYPKSVNIAFNSQRGHYNPVTSVASYFGNSYYCEWCDARYNSKHKHRSADCPIVCPKCLRGTQFFKICNGDGQFGSKGCGKHFNTQACYDEHLKNMCKREMFCPLCRRYDYNDGKHVCGKHKCFFCGVRHPPGRDNCYITPLQLKDEEVYRLVVYDAESILRGPKHNTEPKYLRQAVDWFVAVGALTLDYKTLVRADDLEACIDAFGEKDDFSRKDPKWWQYFTEVFEHLLRKGYYTNTQISDTEIDDIITKQCDAEGINRTNNEWYARRNAFAEKVAQAGLYKRQMKTADQLRRSAALEYPLPNPSLFLNRDKEYSERKSLALRNQIRRADELIKRARDNGTLLEGAEAEELGSDDLAVFNAFGISPYGEVARRRRAWKAKLKEEDKRPTSVESASHSVNIIVAYIACSKCMKSGDAFKDENNGCNVCFGKVDGTLDDTITSRFIKWSSAEMNTPYRLNKPTYSEDPMMDFLKYLMYQTNRKHRNIVHAHNGGRYDHILAMGKLYALQSVCVDNIIATGNKVLNLAVKERGRTRGMKAAYTRCDFHDSLNIISLPLADLPATFDLRDENNELLQGKGIFPYLYNRPENYDRRLNNLPDEDQYGVDNMKRRQYEEFVKWRKEKEPCEFWLPQILDEYCTQDTRILALSLITMMREIKDITKCDILKDSLTIAGQAMTHYRTNYHPVNGDDLSIARVPVNGYWDNDKQSKEGLKWIKYMAKELNPDNKMVEFHYCQNSTGEYRFKDADGRVIKLDGYLKVPNGKVTCDIIEDEVIKQCPLDPVDIDAGLQQRQDMYDRLIKEHGENGTLVKTEDETFDHHIMEFHGCWWHGCPHHTIEQMVHPKYKKTFKELYEATQIRMEKIRDEFQNRNAEIHEMWECDLKELIKRDVDLKRFFAKYDSTAPFKPRETLKGGRTQPFSMYCKSDDDFEIFYLDFDSLYPSVNFHAEYPLGHPEAVTWCQEVNWETPAQMLCPITGERPRGFVQAQLEAKRGVRIAALPTKIEDDCRMLMSLCRKCARSFEGSRSHMLSDLCPKKLDSDSDYGTDDDDFVPSDDDDDAPKHYENVCDVCDHSDEERAIIGVFDFDELEHAIKSGNYKVTYLYHGLVWYDDNKWSNNLFKRYIADFMQVKVEASGWPSYVKTDEEKDAYIQKYADIGVELRRSELDKGKNPGRRYIAKLFLNSLWGRFGLRDNLWKHKVVTSRKEFANIWYNARYECRNPIHINETKTLMVYRKKDVFEQANTTANVLIAARTTAQARLRLMEKLEKIVEVIGPFGGKPLYCDTDSIIVKCPRGMKELLFKELGVSDFLGCLKEEMPDHEIDEFVAGGAKAYGLKLIHKTTKEITYELKLRGIKQTIEVDDRLPYEVFKATVLHYDKDAEIPLPQLRFNPRLAAGAVSTSKTTKKYRTINPKSIVDDRSENLDCYPFGY